MHKEPFSKSNENIYIIDEWTSSLHNLVAGITTKNEGNSLGAYSSQNMGLHVGDQIEHVIKNRTKLSNILDFPLEHWVGAEQTHGNNIKVVSEVDKGNGVTNYKESIKDTDGFITSESGILLTMCYADCVPIYYLDRSSKKIGVAHAGWKGTVSEIAVKMVQMFEHTGSLLKDIEVVIGPSICGQCYVVDDRVVDKVKKILEVQTEKPYNLIKEGQYHLDLKQLNQLVLRQYGLATQQIKISELCSSCEEKVFFSHRRDKGTTGRMLSFIGLKE